MREIWIKLKAFEDYEVSNLGNIKSLKRNKVKILKPYINAQGYYVVCLCKVSIQKVEKIHQLVAIAFLNHKPCGYELVIDHIDNNPLNNRVDNLQLISNRLNASKDRKNKTSQYVGVNLHKKSNKWVANIRIGKIKKHLGCFNTEEEANEAYQNKLKTL